MRDTGRMLSFVEVQKRCGWNRQHTASHASYFIGAIVVRANLTHKQME